MLKVDALKAGKFVSDPLRWLANEEAAIWDGTLMRTLSSKRESLRTLGWGGVGGGGVSTSGAKRVEEYFRSVTTS